LVVGVPPQRTKEGGQDSVRQGPQGPGGATGGSVAKAHREARVKRGGGPRAAYPTVFATPGGATKPRGGDGPNQNPFTDSLGTPGKKKGRTSGGAEGK